jgi:ABC-2 type transport system permease protein
VNGGMMNRTLRGALAAVAVVTGYGCGSSPITAARVERAMATTFANLVHIQVSWLGLPPMAASDFEVRATCRKLTAGSNAGAGEWACTLLWRGPDRQPLRDAFDLFVMTDGCYTATVSGENLGGPTLRASNGSQVRNLLYTFDGCFDTT